MHTLFALAMYETRTLLNALDIVTAGGQRTLQQFVPSLTEVTDLGMEKLLQHLFRASKKHCQSPISEMPGSIVIHIQVK